MRAARHPRRIGILLADDHVLIRETMREMLLATDQFAVVGEAGDGEEVVTLAARLQPEVILLDISMPKSDPALTLRRVLAASRRSKVVIVTMYGELPLAQHMLRHGAHGYVSKAARSDELVDAILSVLAGHRRIVVSIPEPAEPDEAGGDARPERGMSDREIEVISLVAEALSNRQIAVRLNITEGTVKRHLRNIFGKLDAVSRIDAVNKAFAAGVIPSRGAAGSRDAL
ncbi:response regulator [Streptomyces sp. 6N223]|uniref:response regulator n=1 Tax=Streptomyces sp. 6N223 TaxID=3457412 RepID=UPI003FD2E0C5